MNVFFLCKFCFIQVKFGYNLGQKKPTKLPPVGHPKWCFSKGIPAKMALQIWLRIYAPLGLTVRLTEKLPNRYPNRKPDRLPTTICQTALLINMEPRFGGIRRNEAWKLWQSVLDGCVPQKNKGDLGTETTPQTKNRGKMQVFFSRPQNMES